MDTWRSDVFFVGDIATSKWKHGEVAVFGSTVCKIFTLKCQKLHTPLASLAPCVISSCFFMIESILCDNHKTAFSWEGKR